MSSTTPAAEPLGPQERAPEPARPEGVAMRELLAACAAAAAVSTPPEERRAA